MVDVYFSFPDQRNPRTDTVGRIELSGGGSAANFAVWVARAGRQSALVGRIGADSIGMAVEQELRAEGVRLFLARDPECDTGRVGVIVGHGGERDMICDRRANARLSPEDVPKAVIARAEWVHISGYTFFESGPAAAARMCIEVAVSHGIPVSVDPAAYAFIRKVGRHAFRDLCAGATAILPNIDEGRAMTGLDGPEEIAESLLAQFEVVALKLGADGCLGMRRGTHQTVRERVRLDAIPTLAVDTTGAGDAFDAGFVLEYSRTQDLRKALEQGNEMGAMVAGQQGARARRA
jgi:sugar/nucleoside kinase (ribokinase family)